MSPYGLCQPDAMNSWVVHSTVFRRLGAVVPGVVANDLGNAQMIVDEYVLAGLGLDATVDRMLPEGVDRHFVTPE